MITYRVMTKDDYDAVYRVWYSTPGMGLNTVDDSREGIEKYLKRNPTTCFIALCEDTVIGVILSGHDGRRGYIYHTAVLPEFRGNGIAKQLVNLAMAALEEEGIHKVALVAFEQNEIGNAFWEHIGFTAREDLVYRNKNIHALPRVDT